MSCGYSGLSLESYTGKKGGEDMRPGLDRVEVGRYRNPEAVGGLTGWICTDHWIVFEGTDGHLSVWRRDEDGVMKDSEILLPAPE